MWKLMTPKQRQEIAAEQRAHSAATGDNPQSTDHAPIQAVPSTVFAPQMPTTTADDCDHRHQVTTDLICFDALVARPVTPKEVKTTPKAIKALDDEWKKLRTANVWDETGVRELRDVAAEAKRTNAKAHFGRLFQICVEKGAELPANDPQRKYKGRVVFTGNNVTDELKQMALFQAMGSAPPTMDASRTADLLGLQQGWTTQQADADQAYIQADYDCTPAWVQLPETQWPKNWRGKFTTPVCPLRKALYGHPDSGTHWENPLPQTAPSRRLPSHRSCVAILLRT